MCRFCWKWHLLCLQWSCIHLLSECVRGEVVNVCICLDLSSAPQVSFLEVRVLLGIILSGGLIARHFQATHLGCNYVEKLKTSFTRSSSVVTLHEALAVTGVLAWSRWGCQYCVLASLVWGLIYRSGIEAEWWGGPCMNMWLWEGVAHGSTQAFGVWASVHLPLKHPSWGRLYRLLSVRVTLLATPKDCTGSPSLRDFSSVQTGHFTSITYRLRSQEVPDMWPRAGVSATVFCLGLLPFKCYYR